ncbi:MAG: hypothetical protein EZS28_009965, partial [Streblomastix strix]
TCYEAIDELGIAFHASESDPYHKENISSMSYLPMLQVYLSGGLDGLIKIWSDSLSGHAERTLSHPDLVKENVGVKEWDIISEFASKDLSEIQKGINDQIGGGKDLTQSNQSDENANKSKNKEDEQDEEQEQGSGSMSGTGSESEGNKQKKKKKEIIKKQDGDGQIAITEPKQMGRLVSQKLPPGVTSQGLKIKASFLMKDKSLAYQEYAITPITSSAKLSKFFPTGPSQSQAHATLFLEKDQVRINERKKEWQKEKDRGVVGLTNNRAALEGISLY